MEKDSYIEDVLLNYGMHDDGNQHVEENGGYILQTMVEIIHWRLLCTF